MAIINYSFDFLYKKNSCNVDLFFVKKLSLL